MQNNVTYVSSVDNTWKKTKLNNVIESLNCFVSNTTNDKTVQDYGILSYTGKLYKGLHIQGDKKPKTAGTPVIYNGIILGKIDGNGELIVQNVTNTSSVPHEHDGWTNICYGLYNYQITPASCTTCTGEQFCTWVDYCSETCKVTNCCWYNDYTSWCGSCPGCEQYLGLREFECFPFSYMYYFPSVIESGIYHYPRRFAYQVCDGLWILNYAGGKINRACSRYYLRRTSDTTGIVDYCYRIDACSLFFKICNGNQCSFKYEWYIDFDTCRCACCCGCNYEGSYDVCTNEPTVSFTVPNFELAQVRSPFAPIGATGTYNMGCMCIAVNPNKGCTWICEDNGYIYTCDVNAICWVEECVGECVVCRPKLWCECPNTRDRETGCAWSDPAAIVLNEGLRRTVAAKLFFVGVYCNIHSSFVDDRCKYVRFCKSSRCYDWLRITDITSDAITECVHLNLRYY